VNSTPRPPVDFEVASAGDPGGGGGPGPIALAALVTLNLTVIGLAAGRYVLNRPPS
jgi:hypothetical protein